MKLFEIIELFEDPQKAINIELLIPYKKSLLTIYGPDAALIVTDVFNAVQYGRGTGIENVHDEIIGYIDTELSEEDQEHQIETIYFQTKLLKDLWNE